MNPGDTPTELAAFVWIAAKLHEILDGDLPEWTGNRFEHALDTKTLLATAKIRRPLARTGRPPQGPHPRRVTREPAIFDWFWVDEPKLGLLRILFRLPNDGLPRPDLMDAMKELPGIRQVIETKTDREIIAIGLVRNLDEADHLRARIEEQAPDQSVRMDLVQEEDHLVARRTWLEIAQREARAFPSAFQKADI